MTEAGAPYVLTSFGVPHLMGYLATRDGGKYASPLGIDGLLTVAKENGLAGIEAPLPAPGAEEEALRRGLAETGLRFVAAAGVLLDTDPDRLREALHSAAELGSRVLRVTLSHILCGDRRKMEGGWEAHLLASAERLRQALPLAADLNVAIAVENHQDATTADFLRLADMAGNHPAFGITLDAGNPLSVGEDPVSAARQLAPLIRHAHLKDYTIHFAPEGYRLVRCAAGDGVVDFPAILTALRTSEHELLPGIEIGAQATRTIPILEDGWWACHQPMTTTALLPALRILWEKGRPAAEPYSSAWERGEGSAAVAAEEWDVLLRSIRYFRSLYGEGFASGSFSTGNGG